MATLQWQFKAVESSFCEQKEAKKLRHSAHGGQQKSPTVPVVKKVFCFFFSKKMLPLLRLSFDVLRYH